MGGQEQEQEQEAVPVLGGDTVAGGVPHGAGDDREDRFEGRAVEVLESGKLLFGMSRG